MLDMSKFHTFSFQGQKLSDFGALIAQRPTYPMAVASVELKEIPSRTGDVILNKSRIKNISFEIPIRFVPMACDSDIEKVANKLSDWLYGTDYGEYRDTYHPGYYRRAIVTAIDDVIAGYRSWKNYKQLLRKANCRLVFHKGDNTPMIGFRIQIIESYLSNRLRRLIHR